jgi:hypothetical protein
MVKARFGIDFDLVFFLLPILLETEVGELLTFFDFSFFATDLLRVGRFSTSLACTDAKDSTRAINGDASTFDLE